MKSKKILLYETILSVCLLISVNTFSSQAPARSYSSAGTPTDSTLYFDVVFVDYRAFSSEEGNIITWATILEANLVSYEIERSYDNKPFVTIGKIKAKGSGPLSASYTFKDTKPATGKNLYRLKMINTRNGSQTSATRMVNWERQSLMVAGFSAFPNPAAAGSRVTIEAPAFADYQVQLTALSGQVIQKIQVTGGGNTGISFRIPEQTAKGLYLLSLYNTETQEQTIQKIMLQ
jgi:hypothetical protein